MVETLNALNLPEGIIITRNDEEEITVENKTIGFVVAWRWMMDGLRSLTDNIYCCLIGQKGQTV